MHPEFFFQNNSQLVRAQLKHLHERLFFQKESHYLINALHEYVLSA